MVIDELETMTRVMVEFLSNIFSVLLQLVDNCKRKIKIYTKASLLPFLFQMFCMKKVLEIWEIWIR